MGITLYNNQNAAKRSKQLKIRIFNNNLEVFNSQNGAFRSWCTVVHNHTK